ncbi:hypothetical protein HJG60_011629 [Phyllostomus discolor]|uniref:Uncharacterized protein n=1 Tax=Phyllostomus discolor TaxID=89673 RepID=A0A833ZYE4_9CHIR|nr:hypothetical protein HJG60_011629 [Phyllostomus discolor]
MWVTFSSVVFQFLSISACLLWVFDLWSPRASDSPSCAPGGLVQVDGHSGQMATQAQTRSAVTAVFTHPPRPRFCRCFQLPVCASVLPCAPHSPLYLHTVFLLQPLSLGTSFSTGGSTAFIRCPPLQCFYLYFLLLLLLLLKEVLLTYPVIMVWW